MAEVSSKAGDYVGAAELLAQALPLARESGDAAILARTLSAQGEVSWRMGHLEEARGALDECLGLTRALGDVSGELAALNLRASVHIEDQRLDETEQLCKEVYARAQAVGNREPAMVALTGLGSALDDRPDPDSAAAKRAYQYALALAREIGAQQYVALSFTNIGACDLDLGRLADARVRVREGLALAQRLGAQTVMLFNARRSWPPLRSRACADPIPPVIRPSRTMCERYRTNRRASDRRACRPRRSIPAAPPPRATQTPPLGCDRPAAVY